MSSSIMRLITVVTMSIALFLAKPAFVFAQAVVTTDFTDNQLYYASAGGVTQIGNVAPGVNPQSIIFALTQQLYYTLYGSGQIGVFNPYSRSNSFLVSGLDHPEALAIEPSCSSILVTVQGSTTNKPSLARIMIPSGKLTLVPLTFTPAGLVYDGSGDLFVADSTSDTVHQIDPNSGAILNSLPSPLMSPNNQPDVPNEMVYDKFTRKLFITSSVYGGVYQIPTTLGGYNFITSVPAPANGIISNGGGTLFVAGGDTHIYQYSISQSKLTQLVSVPGLNGLALVPGVGCTRGTSDCPAE